MDDCHGADAQRAATSAARVQFDATALCRCWQEIGVMVFHAVSIGTNETHQPNAGRPSSMIHFITALLIN